MQLPGAFYSPRYPWSKKRYSFTYRLNLWIIDKIQKHSKLRDIFERFLHLNLSINEQKYALPSVLDIKIESVVHYFIIPVEKIEVLHKGFTRLVLEAGSHQLGTMLCEDIDRVFDRIKTKIGNGGLFSYLGIYKTPCSLFSQINVNISQDISTFVTLRVEAFPSERCSALFNQILSVEHQESLELIGLKSFRYLRGVRHYSPENNKLRDIENLLLDLKDEVCKYIRAYINYIDILNPYPPATIEFFSYCHKKEDTAEVAHFLSGISLPVNRFGDFTSDQTPFHFFLGHRLDRKESTYGFQVLVNLSEAVKRQGYISIHSDVQQRLREIEPIMGFLVSYRHLLEAIEPRIVKMRNDIPLIMEYKSLIPGTAHLNKLLKRQHEYLPWNIIVFRIAHEYNKEEINTKIKTHLPIELRETKCRFSGLNLFHSQNSILDAQLRDFKKSFQFLDTIIQQELSRHVIISNQNLQTSAIFIAILALLTSVVAIFDTTERKKLIEILYKLLKCVLTFFNF